ncbi:MAG: M28 family peptidase, partial [Candidatus Kariarchaeum pelagius]
MLTVEELKDNLRQIIGPKHRHPYDEKAKSRMQIVESYLVEYFKSFDWDVELQNVKFDEFTTKWGVSHKNLDGNNIICTKHFDNSKETMIITAHHDTVPLSPGADDNGSGLILLMAIAKYYEVANSKYNVMLISFDFEEIGLVGSEFFAENIHNYFPDTSKIKGVTVLETLGYYSQE